VPFAKSDNVTSTANLVVLDGTGKALPAQFRVMQRWGALNDPSAPIAWLLVEFRGSSPANATVAYTLKSGSSPSFPQVTTTPTTDGLVINTGAAQFELNGKTNRLFQNVWLDLDGNGSYAATEKIVSAAAGTGAVLKAFDNVLYASENDPATITVQSHRSGAAALRVKVEGRHKAAPGSANIGRDVLRYTTYLEFAPGSAEVRAIHTIRNDYYLDAIGAVGIENYELAFKLDTQGDTTTKVTVYGDATASPVAANLASAGRVQVYQDSSGAPTWNYTTGTSFSGYRITTGSASAPNLAASGSRALGITDVSTAKYGVTTAIRYFWQAHPKAIEVDATGRIAAKLLPTDFAGKLWLDDMQNYTTELMFAFHKGAAPAVSSAKAFFRPMRPTPTLQYHQYTAAWSDQGDLSTPSEPSSSFATMAQQFRAYTDSGRDQLDDWGWWIFGEAKWYQNTHTTGSPRNVLSAFLRFAQTGRVEFFEVPEEAALHAASLRAFHVNGFLASNHPNAYLYEGCPYPNTNAYPDDLGRGALPSKYPALKVGIPSTGSGWNGYDEEHMTVDDMYEYTVLTGHPITEEAVKQICEGILTFPFVKKVNTKPLSSRSAGWCTRALMKAWLISGSAQYLQGATQIFKNLDQYRGVAPNAYAVATQDYGKAFPGNYTDTYESPWQMGTVIHGLALYYRYTQDPKARVAMIDMADYLCGTPGWGPNGNFKRFIKTKDWNEYVICTQYDGVGQWLPSAIMLVNRLAPKALYTQRCKQQWDFTYSALGSSWKMGLTNDLWHWWQAYFVDKSKGLVP